MPDTVDGSGNVFVIGDMASVPGVPGMAQGAIQGSKYAARAIRAELKGATRPSANRSTTSTRAPWPRCRVTQRSPRSARWS
jgi:NADH dehydrogenase FAD-containing subunit